jgi:peptide/nickel transport system substrate-binding protein
VTRLTDKEVAMSQRLRVLCVALALLMTGAGSDASAKDEWVIAMGQEPNLLSAAAKGVLPTASDYVMVHIYDGLVDFTGPDLALRPMLAERWENPTPTTWRFYLRKGVKFHNGDPLTAEDVKFTIDYQLANKGSTINAYLGPTEEAKVIDPLTVEIRTRVPFPALLFNLSRTFIIPRLVEKVGADVFAAKPIGSGPYKVAEWTRGQRIVLEANVDYWGGVPTPRRLVWRPITDASTRAAELKTGGVDIAVNPPLGQIKELSTGSTVVLPVKGARVIAYPINTMKKPLDDARVRQAINYAVDRESIVRTLLGGFGGRPGSRLRPPGSATIPR